MNQADIIQKYFGNLSKESGLPLYKQLEGRVEAFIRTNPDNTFFPSERELTRVLGIHRKTVSKALTRFFESGQLQATGKGTFTHREEIGLSEVHPLNFMIFPRAGSSRKEIRILLYENMPEQMKAWQNIANLFEAENPDTAIHFDFEYPHLNAFTDSMYEKLAESPSDIVQLPVSLFWRKDYSTLFADTSPEFRRIVRKEKQFRTAWILRDHPELYERMYPINFGCRFCSCNLELTKKAGLDTVPEDFYELIQALAKKTPLPAWLCGHVNNILDCISPEGNLDPCVKFFYSLFNGLNPLEHGFFQTQPECPEEFDIELFIKGKFIIGQNSAGDSLIYINKNAAFPMKHYLPMPIPGGNAHFAANLFAVLKTSPIIEKAHTFLTSLYRTENQIQFAKIGMIPAALDADPEIIPLLKDISLETFRKFAASGKELYGKAFPGIRNKEIQYIIQQQKKERK